MTLLERIEPKSSFSSSTTSSASTYSYSGEDEISPFDRFREDLFKSYFFRSSQWKVGDPLIKFTDEELANFERFVGNDFKPEEWIDFLGILIKSPFDSFPIFKMLKAKNREYSLVNCRHYNRVAQKNIKLIFDQFIYPYINSLDQRNDFLEDDEEMFIRCNSDKMSISEWLEKIDRLERCQVIAIQVFDCVSFMKISDFLTLKEPLEQVMDWIKRKPRPLGSMYAISFVKHMWDWNHRISFFALVTDPEAKDKALVELAKCIILSGFSQQNDRKSLLAAVKRMTQEDVDKVKQIISGRLLGAPIFTYKQLMKTHPLEGKA